MITGRQLYGKPADNLANNLYIYRKNRRLTQKAAAKMIGVSNVVLGKYEDGTSCPLASLLPIIAGVYGVSIGALFYDLSNDIQTGRLKCMEWDRRLILSYLRHKSGKNLKEVAMELNAGYSTVKQWELGDCGPLMDRMGEVLEYYGVTGEGKKQVLRYLVKKESRG